LKSILNEAPFFYCIKMSRVIKSLMIELSAGSFVFLVVFPFFLVLPFILIVPFLNRFLAFKIETIMNGILRNGQFIIGYLAVHLNINYLQEFYFYQFKETYNYTK
jgi:hypothetical protein